MHITTNPKKVLASAVISELQSSDMYLTLVARLFDLRANLNGVRVTEAFLDEIIENESRYVCHPLYADIRGLLANKTVGHMYNARTGEFYSTQIGAFYHFEKEVDGDNAYLLGYARVPKRNKALCKVLGELFADNALKFSFEVNCGAYSEEADGTLLIDADERNYWEGECVVTFPACETAIAKQLVAECLSKGDDNMEDTKILTAETEPVEVAEDVQTAETIFVTQDHMEIDQVRAYNCDTGEEVEQRVTVETTTRTPVQIAEEDSQEEEKEDKEEEEENIVKAEEEIVAEKEEEQAEEEEKTEKESEEKKEMAEAHSDLEKVIAELCNAVESLRTEISELKNASIEKTALAEQESQENIVVAEASAEPTEDNSVINPFMASMSAPKKYSLLDKPNVGMRKYSLLDRA